jgi:hypothetical protein
VKRRYTREDLRTAIENAVEIAAQCGPDDVWVRLNMALHMLNNQKKDD